MWRSHHGCRRWAGGCLTEELDITIVETDRLTLRPFEAGDIDFLDELHGDLRVMRYILGRVRSHDENIAYLKRLFELEESHGIGQRIVIRKDDNRPVGRCGMSFFYRIYEQDIPSYHVDPAVMTDGASRVTELGYSFLQEYWGRGYASEAAAAMRDYGLKVQKFPHLHSIIIQENTGSIGVAEKIGAKRMRECLCLGRPGWDYLSRL